ncbi:MAG: DUF4870 domain-containing protein [Bacillota bacterium]|nr:DUF4870 domain-containing protein [Bacillota bacterium]
MDQNPDNQSLNEVTSDDKNMAMLLNLLGIFTGFIGPLIIWLLYKEKSQFINESGKGCLNFQISFVIYYFAAFILTFIIIGLIAFPILGILFLIFAIKGTIEASNGRLYAFPMSITFLK